MNLNSKIENSIFESVTKEVSLEDLTLIEYAAFFGSLSIFKFLLLNHASITNKLLDDAIAGGNTEIIHICQQYKCNVQINSFQMAIKYYHNDILAWLIENNQNLIDFINIF